MGHLGRVRLGSCALALLCATSLVHANTVSFSTGTKNTTGYTSISPDDYGSYGFLIGQQFDDEFYPEAVASTFTPTYLTGVMLFVTKPGAITGSIILSNTMFWYSFIETPPPTPDGIVGPFTRTVKSQIAVSSTNAATSSFVVADTAAEGVELTFDLSQQLTSDNAAVTSQMDQIYTVTNTGLAAVDLVFHEVWDPDLAFNGANKDFDDIVGIGPGLCGVYQHDGDPRWSVALGNGPMSTVPMTYYYAGKEGFVPGAGPAFAPISATIDKQWTWINRGITPAWQNYVVGAGVLAPGESDPALNNGTTYGDATLGTEYRFSLQPGASETVHIRRYYGTTTIPCFVSTKCGNGTVDAGELCDGADTAACVGSTCTASACGDNYTNATAGEACDTGGADTADCNGLACTTPTCGDGYANAAAGEACDEAGDTATCNANCTVPACGDGYANAAAGEACDDDGDSASCNANCTLAACGDGYANAAAGEECDDTTELCDPTTCRVTFTLGGGCAGCGAGGDTHGAIVLLGSVLIVLLPRRSRYDRRRGARRGRG